MTRYFAKVDQDDVVIDINTFADEDAEAIVQTRPGTWIETFMRVRGGIQYTEDWMATEEQVASMNTAEIGGAYNAGLSVFIPISPFPSWDTLDPVTCLWLPPIPMPTEGGPWSWDEGGQSWIII